MLILTRRPGESVKIGDDITVTVLGIKGNQLRLGFTAPAHVPVHREEVYQRIQAEKLTNISQARSGSTPLRLLGGTPDASSESGLAAPRLEAVCTDSGSEQLASSSGSVHAEPSLVRGNLKVSPQTRKELLKW